MRIVKWKASYYVTFFKREWRVFSISGECEVPMNAKPDKDYAAIGRSFMGRFKVEKI